MFSSTMGLLSSVLTRANHQPAFAAYSRDNDEGAYHAYAVFVLAVEGGRSRRLCASGCQRPLLRRIDEDASGSNQGKKETPVIVRFLGSGDTVGSGGRFQTCISVRTTQSHLLIDCGASSLIAMRRFDVDPGTVDAIFLTHLHGDHFGGIPFFVLDAQFSRRERPLIVAGPPGTEARVCAAMDILFPGSAAADRRFPLRFVELLANVETAFGAIAVTAAAVIHASGAPAYALRVAADGKIVTYSGDTEWTDVLVPLARDADLFICEAYRVDKQIKNHLDYATLCSHRSELACRRLVLTHLGRDMLDRRAELAEECAEDGLTLSI